ncbi:MAG: MFS transporter [Bryobacteraceae bacterium]|jgi:MFS family permease
MALVVLFLINVLNFYDRQALGAIAEPLNREFHLTDTQFGALSTVFTVVYGLAGLPLGRLADTSSRKRLLAAGVTVWAGLTGLGGLAASYAMLLATRLGVGIGEAVCAPAATSWIGDAVPAARRTRALAMFMMAVPVGGLLSFSIGGPVAQAYGWRSALALAALPSIFLAPAVLWLKEPKRTAARTAGASSPAALMRMPAFWWIAASGAIVNFALYSFSSFFPAFLTRFHHLSVARAGIWAGVGSGAAGIIGALAAGALGDRLGGNLGRARMRLAAAASLAAAPSALVAIAAPAGAIAVAIPMMMVAYGLLQMYYGLVYAAMQDVVPANLRGAAMGGYFVVQYLGGAAWGPLVTGRLSDHFAHAAAKAGMAADAARAAGLHQAMYAIPALALALAAVLWTGARSIASKSGAASLVS